MKRLRNWILRRGKTELKSVLSSKVEIPKEPKSATAFLALETDYLPSAKDVHAYMTNTWPFAETLGTPSNKDNVIFFETGTSVNACAILLPAPIPKSALELAVETAYTWPEAEQELDKSRAHFALVVFRAESARDAHMKITMLAQAIANFSKPLALFFGTAESVWSPTQLKEDSLSMTREKLPVVMWFGWKLFPGEGDTVSGCTYGLENFGNLDVEVQNSTRDEVEVLAIVGDVGAYLVNTGALIKPGETVGDVGSPKIAVAIGKSFRDPTKDVYVLDF